MISLQFHKPSLSDRISERLARVPRIQLRGNVSAVAKRGRGANLRLFGAIALVTGPLALFIIWATRWVRDRRLLVNVEDLDVATTEAA
jgi:hypothetical protein